MVGYIFKKKIFDVILLQNRNDLYSIFSTFQKAEYKLQALFCKCVIYNLLKLCGNFELTIPWSYENNNNLCTVSVTLMSVTNIFQFIKQIWYFSSFFRLTTEHTTKPECMSLVLPNDYYLKCYKYTDL